MTRATYYLLAFALVVSGCAEGQHSAARSTATAAKSKSVQTMELDGKYTIEVPSSFSYGRMPDNVAAFPLYVFDTPTTIKVEVLPYSGLISINPKTGKLVPPASGDLICELNHSLPDPTVLAADDGTPLTRYFTQGDTDVYYGCAVTDNAYECSAHQPCPHPAAPETRYTTTYDFAVFDLAKHSIVEFTATHDGPLRKITRFEGDAKLLRDKIVPSLRAIP